MWTDDQIQRVFEYFHGCAKYVCVVALAFRVQHRDINVEKFCFDGTRCRGDEAREDVRLQHSLEVEDDAIIRGEIGVIPELLHVAIPVRRIVQQGPLETIALPSGLELNARRDAQGRRKKTQREA